MCRFRIGNGGRRRWNAGREFRQPLFDSLRLLRDQFVDTLSFFFATALFLEALLLFAARFLSFAKLSGFFFPNTLCFTLTLFGGALFCLKPRCFAALFFLLLFELLLAFCFETFLFLLLFELLFALSFLPCLVFFSFALGLGRESSSRFLFAC